MYRNFIKRILDVFLALIILVFGIPFIIIGGIVIKLDSEGPIFFKQTRIGKNNKEFSIYKLRTMDTKPFTDDGKKRSDRERITKAGRIIRKLSVDELPQLWNVLKGDMSFIGPRPLLVRYLPYYDEVEIRRHDVRPGITGLAQVNGRSNLDWETRFAYDVEYVDNISFSMDLTIVFKTIKKIILGSDSSAYERPKSLVDFDKHREGKRYR